MQPAHCSVRVSTGWWAPSFKIVEKIIHFLVQYRTVHFVQNLKMRVELTTLKRREGSSFAYPSRLRDSGCEET